MINVFAGSLNIILDGTYNYDLANEVVDYTNAERAKVGVSSLTMDYELTQKANERAKEIALYFSHTRPDGTDVIKTLKVDGENIAAGTPTAKDTVEDWMDSSGHKANILNTNYKSIGVGSYTTENGMIYWVQVFSTKKASNLTKMTGSIKKTKELVKYDTSFLKSIVIQDLKTIERTLNIGESYTIKSFGIQNSGWKNATVYTTIDNSNGTFKSSNEKVATIDKNGTIKAICAGEATITVSLSEKTASYKIKVLSEEDKITRVSLNKSSMSLKVEEEQILIAKVYPETITTKNFSWTSSNEKVAVVDKEGKVTAISLGTADITVTTTNGKSTTCFVKVEEENIPITNIYIREYITSLYVGDSASINVEITPTNTTEKVTYQSSNEKVATIDKDGKIVAISTGKAQITISSKYLKESFTINVKNKPVEQQKETKPVESNPIPVDTKPTIIPIERIDLNYSEKTIKVGETFKIQASVLPTNTTESTKVSYGCSTINCYKIATITSDGTVTGVSAGEVEFNVYAGSKIATCKIKVEATDEIESLSFPYTPSNLHPNEVRQLKVVVNPTTAKKNGFLTWTSSNEKVIAVGEEMIFTHAKGEATITVTAPNGVSTSITLTVD